jgi:hypothetical protein
MIKIEKPNFNQKDIIDECTVNVRKQPTLKNILTSKTTIEEKSKRYDELAESGKLGRIKAHVSVRGGATKDDMVWLYDKKFVSDKGRKYYDKIKKIPPYDRCPFCGVRRVSTLDHYLPKTEYPTYSITIYNLVASCSDCNKKKESMVFYKREEELFHPYYDDFDDGIWLKAEVEDDEGITFSFYTEKPPSWTCEKFQRTKNHFIKLDLNRLYISHAAEEFAEFEGSLERLYKTGRNLLVQEYLADRIKDCRSIMKNTWRAAMYNGLLDSKWFFNEYLPGRYK